MTSYFILIACRVIFWLSYQQKIVALSSTETKLWLSLTVAIHLLFWTSNPIQEKCSKYNDIHYYYIRDLIKDEQIKPYYML